jgi:hypothetical protein
MFFFFLLTMGNSICRYVKVSVSCCSYHRRKSCHLGIPGRIGAIELVKCSAVMQDGFIFMAMTFRSSGTIHLD